MTKLNSSIAGLQHAIEQLSRAQQHPTSANVPQHAGTFKYLPVGMKPADIRRWMESSKYISFNHQANALLRKQGSVLGNRAYYKGLVYRIGGASNAARLFESGRLEQLDPSLAQAYENQMNRFRSKSNTPS